MGLSVIVVSYESHPVLEECLAALVGRPGIDEVIVADCSLENPARDLGMEYPAVEFIHFDQARMIPELRWAGLRSARGEFVAWLEAWMVPAEDWSQQFLTGFRLHPQAVMIGGAVSYPSSPRPIWQWAYYFCEYSSTIDDSSETRSPSGANVCFRRDALEQLAGPAWENEIEQAFRAAGAEVLGCGAAAEFRPEFSLSRASRQRLHYGRDYAAARFSGPRRWLHALLPAVLFARLAARAFRCAAILRFVAAAPWIVWFVVVWSLGEAGGYVFGASSWRRIY